MEDSGLLTNIATALGLALAGGVIARFLKIPSIIGYLAAGIVISPVTPGPTADSETISEVAELGVIFLMFGIGLSFDLRELRAVQGVVIPGALALAAFSTSAGTGVGVVAGLGFTEALVLGFAISVCSSAVLSRTLSDRGLLDSVAGRVAIGWTVAEDVLTIVILAILPSLDSGGGTNGVQDAAQSVGLAIVFVGIMFVAGTFVIPPALRYVARFGSRELFIVAVVALALGIAAGATAFDGSVALGAFIAGVVISETGMGHQATADVIPLREAFAVLFFVSVGMLLDPAVVLDHVTLFLVIAAVIVVGRSTVVTLLFSAFPHSGRTALIVGAGVAQVGEFSFLIAAAGLDSEVISEGTYNVILAAAVASIALNPLLFAVQPRVEAALAGSGPLWRALDRQGVPPMPHEPSPGGVVILGFGRVGSLTSHALDRAGVPYVIVESDIDLARRLQAAGRNVVWGDAATPPVLERTQPARARLVIVALPDENSTLLAVTNVRKMAPEVPIVVRGRNREELGILRQLDVQEVVMPAYEGGLELMRQALLVLGFSDDDVEGYRLAVRDIQYTVDAGQG